MDEEINSATDDTSHSMSKRDMPGLRVPLSQQRQKKASVQCTHSTSLQGPLSEFTSSAFLLREPIHVLLQSPSLRVVPGAAAG